LTDEEIVKALGNCKKDNCIDCPYFIDEHTCKANILLADALDLINRLQEENERLTEEKDKYQEKWQTSYMNELNLQKQVDELKLELQGQCDKGVKAGCLMSKVKEQQAVKGTAKDILDKAIKIDRIAGSKGFVCIEALKELCKNKGVEVE
jgi:hypothetical protein